MSRESDENFDISRFSMVRCLDSIFGLKIADTKHDDHLPSRYNPGIQLTHTYRYGVGNEGWAARHGPIPDESFLSAETPKMSLVRYSIFVDIISKDLKLLEIIKIVFWRILFFG